MKNVGVLLKKKNQPRKQQKKQKTHQKTKLEKKQTHKKRQQATELSSESRAPLVQCVYFFLGCFFLRESALYTYRCLQNIGFWRMLKVTNVWVSNLWWASVFVLFPVCGVWWTEKSSWSTGCLGVSEMEPSWGICCLN